MHSIPDGLVPMRSFTLEIFGIKLQPSTPCMQFFTLHTTAVAALALVWLRHLTLIMNLITTWPRVKTNWRYGTRGGWTRSRDFTVLRPRDAAAWD